MKMKCEVIQDLLPLYCDHQASPESCQLIEEHLRECDACKQFYETILEPEDLTEEKVEDNLSEMDPLKKIKKAMRIKIIIAVLASIAVISTSFYFLFIQGQQVSSADMVIETSAYMDKDDESGDTLYTVKFEFDLQNGKCIDVRDARRGDSEIDSSIVVLKPYGQIKVPFDDRGEYPGQCSFDTSKDTPFTDEDIIVIQYKDKSVEYHLKDIAEKDGIQ